MTKPLNATWLQRAEYARSFWTVTLPAHTPLDVVSEPVFWAHVAQKFRQWDRIEVRAEGGEFFAELIVTEAKRLEAKVAFVTRVEFAKVVAADPISPRALVLKPGTPLGQADEDEVPVGYAVVFRGRAKWSVVRNADGGILTDMLGSRQAAQEWLADHLKPQQAA